MPCINKYLKLIRKKKNPLEKWTTYKNKQLIKADL